MDSDLKELLDMLRRCAREEKATLKLNEVACRTILDYIEKLKTNGGE